jgi:radical SAM protein with 4Fe4S-binding SPASM domain
MLLTKQVFSKEQTSPFTGNKYIYHGQAIQPLLSGSIWKLLAQGETPGPITVDLDVSNDCSQACQWCNFMHMHKKKEYLGEQTGIELLNTLHKMGTKSILFSGGGEPTTSPHLADFINTSAELNIAIGLYTNGSIMPQSLLDSLAHAAHFVRVSFEAGNEQLYNQLHRPKSVDYSFPVVVRNIQSLVEASKTSLYNFDVGISFLLCPENLTSIVETAKLVKSIGVNYFQVKPEVLKPGKAQKVTKDLLAAAEKEFAEVRELEDDLFKPYILMDKLTEIATTKYVRNYSTCLGHFMAVKIAANGKVYLCAEHAGEPAYELGDLYEQTFSDIWNGPQRRAVIANIDLENCQWGCKGNFRTIQIMEAQKIKHPWFI